MQLHNQVAVITGAGSGIGYATALLFAKVGAKVAAIDLDAEELQAVVDRIHRQGGEAIALSGDISNPQQMQAIFNQINTTWGKINIVFANAGVNGVWAPLEELDLAAWENTLKVNLTGTFLTVKSAIPSLKVQGGSVIITASVNGTRMFSNTGATAYACSKAAQVAFAKMIALELAPFQIRVNVICPGAIESDINENTQKRDLEKIETPVQFPEGVIPLTQGQSGKPEQVAQLVLFLASPLANHITGTEIWIDGGQSLLQG